MTYRKTHRKNYILNYKYTYSFFTLRTEFHVVCMQNNFAVVAPTTPNDERLL